MWKNRVFSLIYQLNFTYKTVSSAITIPFSSWHNAWKCHHQVASATSAAAATATAQRAKEHEERSSVMYSQTEELMKFQFMSMSLSYFSGLNMMKQMRDINTDTTTAAIAGSADAAAAAAASAAAASIPSLKHTEGLGGDAGGVSIWMVAEFVFCFVFVFHDERLSGGWMRQHAKGGGAIGCRGQRA